MSHELERQLREVEARFQSLVEAMPAITYVNAWHKPHSMLYVSPHAEELLGYPTERWLDQSGFVYSIVHPDDLNMLHAENARTEATGDRFSLEFRLIAHDGRIVWVRDECVPVYDAEGKPLFYQGIMIDVSDRHRAEEALRDSEERFRGAFNDAAIAIGIGSVDGRLIRVNTALCEMLGYREDELVGIDVRQIVDPSDVVRTRAQRAELLAGTIRSFSAERRYVHKDGHIVWGLDHVSLTRDEQGNPLAILVQIQDITDRKRIESSLLESEGLFRGAFTFSMVGMTISGPDGRYLRANQAFCEMIGYSEAELRELRYDQITDPDDVDLNLSFRKRLLAGEIDHFQIEKRYVHAAGYPVWALLAVAIVRDGNGDPLYIIGQALDITDRKVFEERLTHQAFHDSLTGLPNRALLYDRIHHALERAQRNCETIAIMFMDLDGFKTVNDSYGHAIGDQLLVELGNRLRTWIRTGDTVARLGGDEFTILLEDIGTIDEATQIATRIIDGLDTPVTIEGVDHRVHASLGIAFNHPNDLRSDVLLRHADTALYRAKRAGGGQYAVYSEETMLPNVGTDELRAT